MLHKLIFITCLCLVNIGFAQFTDDFTDGDFTNNPIWSGDNALFTAATGELNSQNTGANTYYLSTPSTTALNAQWDFYFNMMFGTSGANYVDVYLVSDVADVTNPNNGYFVRIGGTPDEVSLFKMVGGTPSMLIDGPDGSINSSSNNPFNVRVTRNVANNWTLEYDDGVLGPYTNVGSVVDNSFTTSAFFGIAITQSAAASPINNHFFDNISVGAIVGDTSAPVVDSLVVVNSTNLDVYFNEPVDLVTSQTVINYTADGGLGNPNNAQRDLLDSSIVHLTFATAFTNSQPYNLTIINVEDTISNAITNIVEPFIYVVVIVPNTGDVIINEIFADPSPQIGLPGEEFVELYNKSNNAYILNNWQFVNSTTAKTLPNFALLPNSYVILCDVNDTALYSPFGDVIGISSFTALTNGGDSLTLMDDNSNVIDIVAYDISWYNDPSKDDGGYTLELINPKHPCTSSVNWIASADVTGGTPGIQNSVFDTLPDTQNPIISSVDILSATQLNVMFNEIMDSTSIANATFAINNGISVTGSVINPNNQEVGLTVSPALDSSTVYKLTITGGNDCSGNPLNPNTINFGIGKAPLKYEVIITELFPDPSPTIGLPTEEFLELYNNTNKIIDLSNCWISDLSSTVQIASGKILPGEYVIICDDNFENQYAPFGKVITVGTLPSLNNAEDEMTLWGADSSLIHTVHYFDTWYQDLSKEDGGWTLEMVDPNNPCGEANNWRASTKWFGGTPGTQNTAFGTNPDVSLPQLLQANALTDSTLQLTFSEYIESSSLLAATYSINNSITINTITVVDGKNVILNLSNKLTFQTVYTATVTGAADCVGNLIGTNNKANFALPEQGFAGDLIINEVLFNPYTGGSDFVEVYNNSNKYINLQNWNLANIENDSIDNYKPITDQPYLLLPASFLLLTKDAQNTANEYVNSVTTAFLQMETLPTYNNDKGDVYLMNNLNMAVDSFSYDEDMHFALLNSVDGVSLERIDYDRKSNDASNWHSASEDVGFATPGYENSQYQQTNNDGNEINVEPETFSPDNDGYDDVVNINYNFSEGGYVANVLIYDAKGRLIKNLLQSELLATSGTFSWDGTSDNSEKGRIGIYIIFVEVFDLKGDVKSFKKTCVLAGRLD